MTKKKSNGMIGDFMKTGVTTMVGAGMMGASADIVNAMPAGMGKTMAGHAVGFQGIALMGPSIKLAKKSLKI